jgi:hypothetical protein
VSLTVTDSNGAFTTASNFTVVVNDINQGASCAVLVACVVIVFVFLMAVVVGDFCCHVSAVLHSVPAGGCCSCAGNSTTNRTHHHRNTFMLQLQSQRVCAAACTHS